MPEGIFPVLADEYYKVEAEKLPQLWAELNEIWSID